MTLISVIKTIFSVAEFKKSWTELKSSELGKTTEDISKGLVKSHNKIVKYLDAESPEAGVSNRDQIKSIVSTTASLTAEIVVKGVKDTIRVAEDYSQASMLEPTVEIVEPIGEVTEIVEYATVAVEPIKEEVVTTSYAKMTKKQLIAEFGFKKSMTKKAMLVELAQLEA